MKGQDATSHGRRWEENEGEGCNWSVSGITIEEGE